MKMAVRAKFRCGWIETDKDDPELKTIHMNAVYSPDPKSENGKFWKLTPSGTIQLTTVNESAWQQFEEEAEYFVDFSKVEELIRPENN